MESNAFADEIVPVICVRWQEGGHSGLDLNERVS